MSIFTRIGSGIRNATRRIGNAINRVGSSGLIGSPVGVTGARTARTVSNAITGGNFSSPYGGTSTYSYATPQARQQIASRGSSSSGLYSEIDEGGNFSSPYGGTSSYNYATPQAQEQINALAGTFNSGTPTGIGTATPSVGTAGLPNQPPTVYDPYEALAAAMGQQTYYDNLTQQNIDGASSEGETKQTLLDRLAGNTPQAQAEERFPDYYAEQKAKISEINSLNDSYNNIKAGRDQQIAQETGRFGIQDFTNNRVAQIQRNAAPELNRISAEVNAKAAVMSQNEKLFDQAVDAASADAKYRMDMFQTFYDMNQDTISRMDKNKQQAFSNSLALAKFNYEQTYDSNKIKAELISDAANQGIDLSSFMNSPLSVLQNEYAKKIGGGDLSENPTTPEEIQSYYDSLVQDAMSQEASREQAENVANQILESQGLSLQGQTTTPGSSNTTTFGSSNIEMPKFRPLRGSSQIDFTPTFKSFWNNLFS